MIRLQPVDPQNWRLPLSVAQWQKRYVADRAVLLARAYAYRAQRSRALVIYDDDTPVGMALYYDSEELGAYDFSQFFIDERYQGRGLGAKAAQQILEAMKSDGKYDKVTLCYIEGNDAAKHMYETLGFHLTGERDGDEIVMEKALR